MEAIRKMEPHRIFDWALTRMQTGNFAPATNKRYAKGLVLKHICHFSHVTTMSLQENV